MSTELGAHEQSRTFRRRGILILSLFAILWAAVAASGLSTAAGWVVRIGAVVVAGGLIAFGLRRVVEPERVRRQPDGWLRTVGLVNGGQFLLIVVVVVLGIALSVPQIVPPAVCLLVGLHFFPLARLFDQPQYTATAVGLCAGAVLGAIVLAVVGQEPSRIVVGTIAALTLWGTAARLATTP